jgi:hypothetical protein
MSIINKNTNPYNRVHRTYRRWSVIVIDYCRAPRVDCLPVAVGCKSQRRHGHAEHLHVDFTVVWAQAGYARGAARTYYQSVLANTFPPNVSLRVNHFVTAATTEPSRHLLTALVVDEMDRIMRSIRHHIL